MGLHRLTICEAIIVRVFLQPTTTQTKLIPSRLRSVGAEAGVPFVRAFVRLRLRRLPFVKPQPLRLRPATSASISVRKPSRRVNLSIGREAARVSSSQRVSAIHKPSTL